MAFDTDQAPTEIGRGATDTPAQPRRPVAFNANANSVSVAEIDVFDPDTLTAGPPPPTPAPVKVWRFGRWALGAVFLLTSAAFGLWIDSVIRQLFARNDWLGWALVAVAAFGALALFAFVVREAMALRKLAKVQQLQQQATAAQTPAQGRAVVQTLLDMVSQQPETARGRRNLASTTGEIIDGQQLVRYAELELLAPLDIKARQQVLDAAKRVSMVTAISPRALVDVGYVIFEAARLIRTVSEAYGGRPGMLGFLRLARSVVAHLAVTGTVAVGDSLVQQLVGHGLAARLSARLGEGVINGLMTVRVGIAAIELCRPLRFSAVKRPGVSDFMSDLATFAGRNTADKRPTEPKD
jgi:putative membrane protein